MRAATRKMEDVEVGAYTEKGTRRAVQRDLVGGNTRICPMVSSFGESGIGIKTT